MAVEAAAAWKGIFPLRPCNWQQGTKTEEAKLRPRRMDEEDRKWEGSLPSAVSPRGTQASAEQYSVPRGPEALPDILWKL